MKNRLIVTLLSACCIFFAACTEKPVRVFMAGDSTMANKPLSKTFTDSTTNSTYEDENLERGWGQLLPTFFNDKVEIHNHAMNGRSTRTFISEGRWQAIVDSLQAGDYVVIQFGHNDQSKEKVDRYTSPEDYKKNLENFVADVQSKGATPIFCTPVMRRRFDSTGTFYDVHGVYPGLVREVAAEKNVLLADMHHDSEKVMQEYGQEGTKELFLHIPAGAYRSLPNGKKDDTHFNEKGATIMAGLFVQELKELDIKPLVKNLK